MIPDNEPMESIENPYHLEIKDMLKDKQELTIQISNLITHFKKKYILKIIELKNNIRTVTNNSNEVHIFDNYYIEVKL